MELEIRSSKIKDIIFESEWANPKAGGAIYYYHRIIMENGNEGSIGAVQKFPTRLQKGATVTYTIDDKQKVKVLTSDSEGKTHPNEYANGTAPAKNQKKAAGAPPTAKRGPRPTPMDQAAYMGYAWSYAKDLIIAGKTMDHVEELENVARFIYNKIGDMLAEDLNPEKKA